MVLKIVGTYLSDRFILQGNTGFVTAFSIITVLSIGVSYITYKVIEIPGINLGKRIIENISSRP
jgi:peptidoglycan/LPS O-acetylase OafA/YrhL